MQWRIKLLVGEINPSLGGMDMGYASVILNEYEPTHLYYQALMEEDNINQEQATVPSMLQILFIFFIILM